MVKQKAVTTNTQLLQYAQSQRPRSCRGEETNAKDYTRSFKVDSSHMTVSSEVKSFEFAQVDLRSTWGHFSFKWGHIFLDRSDSQVYSWTKLHMMCSSASSSASIDPAMGYHCDEYDSSQKPITYYHPTLTPNCYNTSIAPTHKPNS